MTNRIEAWLEGRHVGQFAFGDGAPVFTYDDDAPQTPVSLSLPRDGSAQRKAAGNFLENLLPENAQTRARMASIYQAGGTSAFDLLRAAGGDIAGGLVLLPEGQAPSDGPAELSPALARDIAERAAAIKRDGAESAPRGVNSRFSLAGAQGKFAVAWVDRDWYWSNGSVPSTHIVKPGNPGHHNIDAAEAAAMSLADAAGLRAPQAEVMRFRDQTAYVVARFDRESGGGLLARRLHAEDFTQSLGLPPEKKYEVSVGHVFRLLTPIDDDGVLRREFVKQLAFNVLIGNADAHAKNYSLLLRPTEVSISPMYDVIPLFLYPKVEQVLAMRVGRARFAAEVTPDHWANLATSVGQDPEELLGVVREVASAVGEGNDEAWAALDPNQEAQARGYVAQNVERALRPLARRTRSHRG